MVGALVGGVAVVGMIVGACCDPIGQRYAKRSAQVERGGGPGSEGSGPGSGADPLGFGEAADVPAAVEVPDLADAVEVSVVAEAGFDQPPPPPPPPPLLPSGPDMRRTAGAALVTGALFAAGAVQLGAVPVLAPYCVWFALLVVVSCTDLSSGMIPRAVLYPAAGAMAVLFTAVALVDGQGGRLAHAAIGGVAAFLVFFVLWWVVPRGLGFGDVRLAGVIGFAVGWLGLVPVYLALVAGFLCGLVLALVLALGVGRGERARVRIPFAPPLAVGAVAVVLWHAHSL